MKNNVGKKCWQKMFDLLPTYSRERWQKIPLPLKGREGEFIASVSTPLQPPTAGGAE